MKISADGWTTRRRAGRLRDLCGACAAATRQDGVRP